MTVNNKTAIGRLGTGFIVSNGVVSVDFSSIASGISFKGGLDASTNPNFPAGTQGDMYKITVAGKVGGTSGATVEIGDTLLCFTTSATGDLATVGANWLILQTNIDSTLLTTAYNHSQSVHCDPAHTHPTIISALTEGTPSTDDFFMFYDNTGATNLKVPLSTLNTLIDRWIQVSNFTSAPTSTSTITTTSDLTGSIKVGNALRYTIGGVDYFGIITAITSTLITIAGAPLSGTITALYFTNNPNATVQVDFMIPGKFADSANTNLLASDAFTKFAWMLSEARLVQFRATVFTADTGAANPIVNVSVGGNNVCTSNSNAGLTVGTSWVSTTVDISTANYVVSRGAAFEIVTDASGTNDDATYLTISMVLVVL